MILQRSLQLNRGQMDDGLEEILRTIEIICDNIDQFCGRIRGTILNFL